MSTGEQGRLKEAIDRRGNPLASVRGRIAGGFVLLIAILGGAVGTSVWLVEAYRSDLAQMEVRSNVVSLLQETKVDAVYAGASLEQYILTGDEKALEDIRNRSSSALDYLTQAAALAKEGDPEQQARLDQIVQDSIVAATAINQVVTMRQRVGPDAAAEVMQRALPWLTQFWQDMEDLSAYEREQASLLRQRADQMGKVAVWSLSLSGALGAALGAAAAYLVARSIIRPLSGLEKAANAVAIGDLTARAEVDGPRELARLARTLNYTIGALEERERELITSNEELKERNRQLMEARAMAATDALTGLPNHRAFHEAIRREVYTVDLHGGAVSVVMLDLDGFKAVNDALGHLEGDKVLRECAAAFTQVVRRECVYRYGGDEFAVILTGVGEEEAAAIAEELRRAVAQRGGDGVRRVSISLGVATYPENARSAEELIYRADAAMYWAKAAGKDRVGRWDAAEGSTAGAGVGQRPTSARRR